MFRTDLLSIIRSLNTVFTPIGICHTSYGVCLLARSRADRQTSFCIIPSMAKNFNSLPRNKHQAAGCGQQVHIWSSLLRLLKPIVWFMQLLPEFHSCFRKICLHAQALIDVQVAYLWSCDRSPCHSQQWFICRGRIPATSGTRKYFISYKRKWINHNVMLQCFFLLLIVFSLP
jgi:hypothetical protein